jgi:hypothetical protein
MNKSISISISPSFNIMKENVLWKVTELKCLKFGAGPIKR